MQSAAKQDKQSMPRVLGLTGGIGSGKSCARAMFEQLGVPCLDADLVARQIHQDPQHPAMAAIGRAVPAAISPQGNVSRGSLRTLFASDAAANNTLKTILRPYVLAEAVRWSKAQPAAYVVWETALLMEQSIPCDRILLINTSDAARLPRTLARNPDWSRAQIDSIIAIQPSRDDYRAHAHDIVDNNGTQAQLQARIEQLHHFYLTLWN